MNELNLQLFQWIAGGHAPNGTLLWLATRLALGASWLSVALMAWAAWRQPADRAYFVAVCLLAAAAGMLAHSLAAALNLPRPFVLGLSPSWLGHSDRGSLPSTHATVMFTVALCFLWRPRLRSVGWVVAALAVFTGWARIYVGVHFPLDVVAGLLLAILLAGSLAFGDRLVQQFLKKARLTRPRSTA